MPTRRRTLRAARIGLVAACLLAAGPAQEPADDPLGAINDEFHRVYRAARDEVLESAGPVVWVNGDALTLLIGDERHEADVIPPIYHRLKAVGHAALAVDLALRLDGGTPDDEAMASIRRLQAQVRAALDRLDDEPFDDDQRPRQAAILGACLDALDRTIADGGCPPARRLAFARSMGPLVLDNADDAARAAIDAYDRQMGAWRERLLTDPQWRSLRVVISDRQMPRDRNLAAQYFARLLNVPGEGHRVVYAESLFEEDEVLGLLGTHLLDSAFSVEFFDDPIRMDRDLLGDAAARILEERFAGR